MKLGFVSAILPEQSIEDVFSTAAELGYDCVELMCWPPGAAERRYAGVTHLDVTGFNGDRAAEVQALVERSGVAISGLYPEARSTGRWLAEGWPIVVAYFTGFAAVLLVLGWRPGS